MDELEALGAPIPESLGTADAVNFEAVAAEDPDLIIAIYAGLAQADYDRLAEIAPTIAQPAGVVDYGAPWDVSTRMIGLALGKSEEAEALITDIDGQFAAVREAHPEFQGATAVAAAPYEGIWVYVPEDPRGRFLADLGFEMPEGLAEITGDEFGADLSEEQSALLDVDAVIWITDEATGTDVGGPVYRTLAVHTEGREVFVDSYDNGLGSATSFVTPLSLEFLLDGIVPKLSHRSPRRSRHRRGLTTSRFSPGWARWPRRRAAGGTAAMATVMWVSSRITSTLPTTGGQSSPVQNQSVVSTNAHAVVRGRRRPRPRSGRAGSRRRAPWRTPRRRRGAPTGRPAGRRVLAGLSPITHHVGRRLGEPLDRLVGAGRPLVGVGRVLRVGVRHHDEVRLVARRSSR